MFVKFNKMKKIMGQIRGETIKGGRRNFFYCLAPPQGKSETASLP